VVVYRQERRRRLVLVMIVVTSLALITLDQTPPELAADIMEKGIVITGCGAQLIGIENAIQAETGMPVHRAKHPLYSVVLGSGQCLENFDVLQQVLSSSPQD